MKWQALVDLLGSQMTAHYIMAVVYRECRGVGSGITGESRKIAGWQPCAFSIESPKIYI